MRQTKLFLSAALVLLAALCFSCSTGGDSSDSSSFDSPAAVVKSASQSGDLSTSGISRAIATDVGSSGKDGSVAYMLGAGQDGTADQIFQILGQIADKGHLDDAGFNTAVSLHFDASPIVVQRLQVDGSSGGSVFYIYSSGTYSDSDFKFLLKCTENSYGTLDTNLYFPGQYTELTQIKKTASGKTKFLYRVDTADTSKEDYYQTAFSSSGTIEGYLYQTAEGGIKSTLVSDRSYTGACQVRSSQTDLILLDANGKALAVKKGGGDWTGDAALRTQYGSLIERARSLQGSFPSMSKPSELNELKNKLDAWN